MDLLQNIKPIPLRTFITPIPNHLSIPYVNTRETNPSIHFIESRHCLGLHWVTQLILQSYTESKVIVVFDLAVFWNERNGDFKDLKKRLSDFGLWENVVIVRDCLGFDDLIDGLKKVRDGSFFANNSKNLPLSMIVVDGLSSFYWDLKLKGTISKDFETLGDILMDLKDFYGCSIITTSFDQGFDNSQNRGRSELQMACDVPLGYLKLFRHVFYLRKVYDRSSESNIEIGKYFPRDTETVYTIYNGKISS